MMRVLRRVNDHRARVVDVDERRTNGSFDVARVMDGDTGSGRVFVFFFVFF